MRTPRNVLAIMLVAGLAAFASASTFTSVIVYGDSLSDNGNLYALTGQPPAPYYNGRFSNGPVAVEYLASTLGVPLSDFAWGGATTGIGNHGDGGTPTSYGAFGLPGMQVELADTAGVIAPSAAAGLFVVWGGPNDFLSPSPLDGGDPLKEANRSVSDLLGIVTNLQLLGAQHILVPGMPDLGLTPYFESQGPTASAGATALTNYFNAALVAGLPKGVTYFDTADLMRTIVSDPGAYGFSNVTAPCFNGTTVCSDPSSYLFWDNLHPTTHAHSILGADFASAVPEPATLVLIATGLMLGTIRRRFER